MLTLYFIIKVVCILIGELDITNGNIMERKCIKRDRHNVKCYNYYNKSCTRPFHHETNPYSQSAFLIDHFKIISDHFKIINNPLRLHFKVIIGHFTIISDHLKIISDY